MSQDQFDLMMEVIMATIFGVFGGAVVWLLVPDAQWWLILGTFVFWFSCTFFSANTGSRR